MKTIKVTISDYSKYFPIKVSWNINRQVYSDVFETEQAAIDYIKALFKNAKITDKRTGEKIS